MRLGWHVGTPAEAVGLILSRLREGAERLRKFRDGEGFLPPQAPGTTPDQSFKDAGLPLPGDRYASMSYGLTNDFIHVPPP